MGFSCTRRRKKSPSVALLKDKLIANQYTQYDWAAAVVQDTVVLSPILTRRGIAGGRPG